MTYCIVMPVYERYLALAEFNIQTLDRFWPSHPAIFCCGVPGKKGDPWIPLRTDKNDWIGYVRDAVSVVRRRGFERCYLICEEHIPLFPCNETLLNQELPEQMDKLEAVRIGLHGWGQGRSVNGKVLEAEHLWLERISSDSLWKFELHPALWNLDALEKLLTSLTDTLPLNMRSPWGFERHSGKKDASIPAELKGNAYRVCGLRSSASPLRALRIRFERTLLLGIRFLSGKIFGENAWQTINDKGITIFGYYEGPYPMFRRGVMAGDKLNKDLIRFLQLHGGRKMAAEIVVATNAIRS